MIIDATDLILGRMASLAAKKALLGEKIEIINCEKAVLSGSKAEVIQKFKKRQQRGDTFKGPFYPRKPNMFVRRTIRGMLPYKRPKGRDALKRVKCYLGMPNDVKPEDLKTIETANGARLKAPKYITVEDLSKYLGAKI